MPEPTAQQSHIDRALTNVAIRYINTSFVADQIFPIIPVRHQSDKFFTFTKADWFRDDAGVRAPGTRAQLIDFNLSTDNYTSIERAAGKRVPDEVVDNSDSPLRPFVDATNFTTNKLLIRQEVDVLDQVFGSSWASSATPGTLWSSDAADPFGDIETGVNAVTLAIGRPPNIAALGRGLWRFLRNHPDVIDRIKGGAVSTSPAVVMMQALAALTGIDKIVLAQAVKESNEEGESESRAYIAGNHMFIGYVTPTASIDTPSAGYIFAWKQRQVFRFRENQNFSDVVVTSQSWDTKLTATDSGYLIKSAA